MRRVVDPAVKTSGAFLLHPSFEVVVAATHDRTARANPANHASNDSEDGDHRQDADDGSDRPVARMGCVGLVGHGHWRWLLVYWCSRHGRTPFRVLRPKIDFFFFGVLEGLCGF